MRIQNEIKIKDEKKFAFLVTGNYLCLMDATLKTGRRSRIVVQLTGALVPLVTYCRAKGLVQTTVQRNGSLEEVAMPVSLVDRDGNVVGHTVLYPNPQ